MIYCVDKLDTVITIKWFLRLLLLVSLFSSSSWKYTWISIHWNAYQIIVRRSDLYSIAFIIHFGLCCWFSTDESIFVLQKIYHFSLERFVIRKTKNFISFLDEKFCIFWEIQNFFIKILIMVLNRIEIYSRLGNNLLCVGELRKF